MNCAFRCGQAWHLLFSEKCAVGGCASIAHEAVVETLRCCSHQASPVTQDVKKAFDSAELLELQG